MKGKNNMPKIIAVNASPRIGWNTETIIRCAAEGAASSGAEVEYVNLYQLERFTGCISCFGCKRTENLGKCINRDGLYGVLEKIRNADALIIGTPVYFGDVSASFRALFERLMFQYLTYKKEVRSYNDRQIPVLLVLTSNVPAEYDQNLLDRYKGMFERFIGPTSTFVCGNTLQVNNYEDYNWTQFNVEEKRQRREEVFPQEKKQAYEIGTALLNRKEETAL